MFLHSSAAAVEVRAERIALGVEPSDACKEIALEREKARLERQKVEEALASLKNLLTPNSGGA